MNKQDLNGVRTAQDIERKYNLSAIQENAELVENQLYQVQNELTNFANQTTQHFLEVQTELDDKAEIWFYSGTPSLSSPPASEWGEYSSHVGDMYYDTSTGYAYRFKVVSDVYSWEQIQDKDVVESLALANAASDAADSKRRVFVSTPAPPYDNGDLWINNQELYVCQISKETGTYADGDFIVATKYTDDTLATQVANNLTVVQGQVTTVITDNDELKIKFNQTTSLVNSLTEEVASEIDEREAMIRLGHEQGIPVVELGSTESPVKTKYKNDGMYIEENGTTTSYFKNGKSYNRDMEVLNSLKIGNFAFVPRENGNTSLVYFGGGN
ncbi:MAG: hypothetical protein MJZ37_06235 [Bacilli bacterium]|nr:hypothetical protein [Bacilli bacterium]